jgi:hypothetical protein
MGRFVEAPKSDVMLCAWHENLNMLSSLYEAKMQRAYFLNARDMNFARKIFASDLTRQTLSCALQTETPWSSSKSRHDHAPTRGLKSVSMRRSNAA